uniref:IU_nuc_hydro domain-containing protein n=1 Tax=Panagrellus redivivus TaxID=6233 RepID=A0A7E4V754_PANRE
MFCLYRLIRHTSFHVTVPPLGFPLVSPHSQASDGRDPRYEAGKASLSGAPLSVKRRDDVLSTIKWANQIGFEKPLALLFAGAPINAFSALWQPKGCADDRFAATAGPNQPVCLGRRLTATALFGASSDDECNRGADAVLSRIARGCTDPTTTTAANNICIGKKAVRNRRNVQTPSRGNGRGNASMAIMPRMDVMSDSGGEAVTTHIGKVRRKNAIVGGRQGTMGYCRLMALGGCADITFFSMCLIIGLVGPRWYISQV